MTTHLEVRTSSGTYPLWIGSGLLDTFGKRLAQFGVGQDARLFVISDETVAANGYTDRLLEACKQDGYNISVGLIAPRDESKSLAVAENLYEQMLDAGLRRNAVVIALGGGVVGDLAGFVAATYLRGVRFIQVPTTLLAHDSSLGGKVGINLQRGKNLVGAFHQPIGVVYDVGTLRTLPQREWQNGMAEVIKHALIGDVTLFEHLEQNPVSSYPGEEATERLVAQAVQVKIQVVERDEFEQETRMWLNLGHTVGHAVEQVSRYQFGHGEAVAIGLCVEAEIAAARGWLSRAEKERILHVVAAHGLPVKAPAFPFEQVLTALQVDKKHTSQGWTFVLPRQIGQVEIVRDVTYEELSCAWNKAQEEETRWS